MKLHQTFVCSDQHFGHDKIAQIRGYESAEHFAEVYIEAYNKVVQKHNKVIFAGDVFMGKAIDLNIMQRLKGSKYLVLGNHDQFTTQQYFEAGFQGVAAMLWSASSGVVITHYPVHPSYFSFRQEHWHNYHGHLHTEIIPDDRYVNCCVDQNLYPIQIL